MPCFFNVLLVLMLQLYVVLNLILDEFVLVGKGLLQYIDPILLLIEVIINALILMLVALELVLQDCIFL